MQAKGQTQVGIGGVDLGTRTLHLGENIAHEYLEVSNGVCVLEEDPHVTATVLATVKDIAIGVTRPQLGSAQHPAHHCLATAVNIARCDGCLFIALEYAGQRDVAGEMCGQIGVSDRRLDAQIFRTVPWLSHTRMDRRLVT